MVTTEHYGLGEGGHRDQCLLEERREKREDTDSDSDVHMGIARPTWWFEMIELRAWNKSHTLPETVLDIVILYLEAPHHYEPQHDSYWYTSSQPYMRVVLYEE